MRLLLIGINFHPELTGIGKYTGEMTAWLAAWLSGAKAWLHFQDFEIDAALNLRILPAEGFVAKVLRLFEQRLLRGFDVLSTISRRMCERLQAKGVPRSRILFFPNWVDTKVIYPLNGRPNPLRHELGLAETDTVVLYSGNIGEKQGLDILVEAARSLQSIDNLHFVLCGEGAVKAHLQALAKAV